MTLPEGLPEELSIDALIDKTREPDEAAAKAEASLRARALMATHALVMALYQHGPCQMVEDALDGILAADPHGAGCLIAAESMIGMALAPYSQGEFTNARGVLPPSDPLDAAERAHGEQLAHGLVLGYAHADPVMANAGARALRGPDAQAREVLRGLAMIVAYNWRREDSVKVMALEAFESWKRHRSQAAPPKPEGQQHNT